MRRGMWVSGIGFVLGVAGCGTTPLASTQATDWRTAAGEPVGTAEFQALRQACGPQFATAAFDPAAPVASPASANPAFHPGGAGLLNTTPIGVTSSGASVTVETTRTENGPRISLEQCLRGRGLVPVR